MNKALFFAIAIVSTMAISSASVVEAHTTVSTTSPPATVAAVPSVTFCQASFEHVLANHTGTFEQLQLDLDAAHFTGPPRDLQTAVCAIYYKGMMDYVEATGPKA